MSQNMNYFDQNLKSFHDHFQLCGLLAGQACTTANLNNDNFLVLGVCNFGLANACNLPLAQVTVRMENVFSWKRSQIVPKADNHLAF